MKHTRFSTLFAAMALALPLAAQACNSEPYIGSVCTYAFNWCPAGYLPADGRLLPINGNQALFALVGFTYGGDNQTTFGIPDLRGRFPVGTGAAPGMTPVPFAQKVGQQAVTLNSTQTPLVPHTHNASFTPVTGNTPVTIPGTTGSMTVTASVPVSTATGSTASLSSGQQGYLAGVTGTTGVDPVTLSGPYTTSAPSAGAASVAVNAQASGNPATAPATVQVQTVTGGTVTVAPAAANATAQVSTQSPALGMSVCIAVQGLYPNRP